MAINFPAAPINGNTYEFNSIVYTYVKPGADPGYWRVQTPGTVGPASVSDIELGTDEIKYVSPARLKESTYYNQAQVNGNSSAITALQTSEFGVGQTWTDVTGSRSAGVTYTNTTGKPIFISVYATFASTLNGIGLGIDGIPTLSVTENTNSVSNAVTAQGIIPSGSTYVVNFSGTASFVWHELRD